MTNCVIILCTFLRTLQVTAALFDNSHYKVLQDDNAENFTYWDARCRGRPRFRVLHQLKYQLNNLNFEEKSPIQHEIIKFHQVLGRERAPVIVNSFEEGYLLEFGLIDHETLYSRPSLIYYWVGGSTNHVRRITGIMFSYPSDYLLDDSGI